MTEIDLPDQILPAPSDLVQALFQEGQKFQQYYLWLEAAMPASFFEEVSRDNLMLITHSLMGFDLQDFYCTINLKSAAIAMCLDSPDADIRILQNHTLFGIKDYESFISRLPFPGTSAPLRVATIDFMYAAEIIENPYPEKLKKQLFESVRLENPLITQTLFDSLMGKISTPFMHSLPLERLALAVNMLFRAQTRDYCQYEVRYEDEWNEKETGSMHIVLAWLNTPKHFFLYRLAQVVYRHGLSMKRVNATCMDPYRKQSVLVMALSLHGSNGKPVWDVADIPDFLREIATVKYFEASDKINELLVSPRVISGNMANFLRAAAGFIHQCLVNLDTNLYTPENIEEALCRHPELTVQLCEAFKLKFDPNHFNFEQFEALRKSFYDDVAQLDTGHESNDIRRKNVLRQGMNFLTHLLKTNFYRLNYTALSFRLDPKYLDEIPFDRSKKFPELPYAIFYIYSMNFFGFHIRFKDLARGGLRTVYPDQVEQMAAERNNIFSECYFLALTQHKKNKDIPEGGAKGILFLKPYDQIDSESQVLKRELEWSRLRPEEIEKSVRSFREEQKLEYLYQSQRSFIESLITIVNCDADGTIRARHIVDYWKRPEYIYLGPDENMHDFMIEWIANFSKKYDYKPAGAFISGKPRVGINHKEYGVTSLGVNVYMHQVLKFLGIDPENEPFTVKLSGGPDGDVAGNQLLNFYRFYPRTAKVVALTDKTGTINDDQGLDLEIIKDLFYQNKGIAHYPPEKLSEGGFLVDKERKRFPSAYIQETLCWRKKGGKLTEDWLSGSDTNHLLRFNLHQTKADVFIPAGGRPRSLNETNISEFLDEKGRPTSHAIIEGANLYLNQTARRYLEEKGVLIIKDSSANKGGVICSSFEVLSNLALEEKIFLENREVLIAEILERLKTCALNEADLLLKTHQKTGEFLTSLSDKISQRINQYTYQLLDYFDLYPLSSDLQDPMIRCFLNYCLPTLREKFPHDLISKIPEHHKKAIIACHISCYMVYNKGLDWSPSIVDILPIILSDLKT
ncbi:MAG: NAD-glutamate dehydrogenase [Candidatus Protochlamydia sp.]|nr:NAD-glutamate dehydrogenase [Candidatus Protochlamydia sp.]